MRVMNGIIQAFPRELQMNVNPPKHELEAHEKPPSAFIQQ